MPSPSVDDIPPLWRYGLTSGLVAMPLTLVDLRLSDPNMFSFRMLFVGGLLAGYLAAKNGFDANYAGVVAGAVGSLPGLVWLAPTLIETASAWSTPAGGVVAVGAGLLSVGFGALVGLVGGAGGGWLAKRLAHAA